MTYDIQKEKREAIDAGRKAISSLETARDNLNSAKNWGLVDMFGGGFFTTMIKHSKIDQAKENMEQEENIVILDVRTREEFDTGHIKGAICLPNEEIVEAPEVLPDKEQKILIYCRSGKRSKQAAQKLADMGYEKVLEFGGIMDWPYQELVE